MNEQPYFYSPQKLKVGDIIDIGEWDGTATVLEVISKRDHYVYVCLRADGRVNAFTEATLFGNTKIIGFNETVSLLYEGISWRGIFQTK